MRAEARPLDRRQWLLGIGLGLLAFVTWWQIRRLPREETGPAARPRRPDYRVMGFNAQETDAQGRLSRGLQATELRYYADEDLAELDGPRLVIYRPDGPPWQAEGRLGLARANGEEIELIGAVRVERARGPHNRPFRLETERLLIRHRQGLAETELPVRIESDGDLLTAQGMRLWYLDDQWRTQFKGRARMRLNPPTDTARP